MKDFIIAAAQCGSIKGNIEANVKTHIKFVHTALENNANAIIFPELSLTGYEPEIAKGLTLRMDDPRLSPLKELAEQFDITIITGAPYDSNKGKPYISSLIFDKKYPAVYIKNYLHPGEEQFFSSSEIKHCVLQKNRENIGLAICADVNHPSHAEVAARNGATVYAAGVFMMGGYTEAAQQMQQYASQYRMAGVMANYGWPTGGYTPAGKTAVWDSSGELLACAGEQGDALVLLIRQNMTWSGEVIPV